MDIKEAIFGRRAVREYTGEAIDRDTIRRLVDAAIHAPSAVNQQPWTDGKRTLGLSADCVSIAPIIVGRPKASPAPVPRKEPQIRWVD